MSRSAPAIVLLYHRVQRAASDPFSLSVDPDRFAAHLAALVRVADVVPLADLAHRSASRRVVVTFDDGYADNALLAYPLLHAARVPATIFVTTGFLAGCEPWWDQVERLLTNRPGMPPFVFLESKRGGPLRIDVRTPAGRQRAVRAINRRLRILAPTALSQALRHLVGQVPPIVASPTEGHGMCTLEMLREISTFGLVGVGAHTRTHPLLASASVREQREEVSGSREDLSAALGTPPSAFAYPFGFAKSFTQTSVRLVAEAGFEQACTNIPGIVTGRTRPLMIPRHQVYDWEADELTRRLGAWFAQAST